MVGSLISVLMASRTQAHIFHLQTKSFSAHKALQEYYEGIIPLIDSFAESYQGKYDIITNYTAHGKFVEETSIQMMIFYFQNLADMVIFSGKEIPQDTFLLNQIDELVAFINSTIYKLKVLQ
jgi:hypothetical protein